MLCLIYGLIGWIWFQSFWEGCRGLNFQVIIGFALSVGGDDMEEWLRFLEIEEEDNEFEWRIRIKNLWLGIKRIYNKKTKLIILMKFGN